MFMLFAMLFINSPNKKHIFPLLSIQKKKKKMIAVHYTRIKTSKEIKNS